VRALLARLRRAGRAAIPALVLALGACASTADSVQRATEGPTAEEIHRARFVRGYGRVPTFDESVAWRDELDRRVAEYLIRRPEVGTSPRASQFRFQRRVSVGMSQEEVTLLLGAPDGVTTDEAAMRTAAGRFWPEVGTQAKEMWAYPGGWRLYFEAGRLVDLTVLGKPPLD
jgi:hypothetical protein